MREYDDEQELMAYVSRNYPENVRPHECVASAERMRDELPAELRDEFWEHAAECRRIIDECRASDERDSVNGRRVMSKPGLPGMRLHRCSHCQRILVNEKSRQCLWCGHDWH